MVADYVTAGEPQAASCSRKINGETGMTPLKALLTPILPLILISALTIVPAQNTRARTAGEYYNRGNERQKQRDLNGAIEDYTFAISFDPQFALAWNNRGVVRYLKGELDHAIADCTKAIELKPDYAEAWNNRGNARLDKGRLDEA